MSDAYLGRERKGGQNTDDKEVDVSRPLKLIEKRKRSP